MEEHHAFAISIRTVLQIHQNVRQFGKQATSARNEGTYFFAPKKQALKPQVGLTRNDYITKG